MNAFTNPNLFKIDTLAFKRSASGAVGGRARAKNVTGSIVPMMKPKAKQDEKKK